jgi:hypothetical protein
MFIMNDHLFGALEIFTFVHVGDAARPKRVRLATIHCDLGETEARLKEFRQDNSEVLNSKKIHGDFVFRKYVD